LSSAGDRRRPRGAEEANFVKRTVVAARKIAKRKMLRQMRRRRTPFFGAHGPCGPKDPKDLRGSKGALLEQAEQRAQAEERGA
jgi:hypothetical protein